jgi:hypothetical protein
MVDNAQNPNQISPKRPLLTRLLDTVALWTTSVGDQNPYLRRANGGDGMTRR